MRGNFACSKSSVTTAKTWKIFDSSVLMACVRNPVYELLFTHHQRSLAHHMDSYTTLTVSLPHGLQFPSSIALMTHSWFHWLHSCSPSHALLKPWTESENLGSWLAVSQGHDFAGSIFARRQLMKLISDRLLRQCNGLMVYNKFWW